MENPALKIVIVGGGAAGWITAGLLAVKGRSGSVRANVTVIESPDIPIVGVGEGTWPSMRQTLRTMGISERDFVRSCHASFKQGSKFQRWRRNDTGDFYYHPFDPPVSDKAVEDWLRGGSGKSFSEAVCAQEALSEQYLSPKSLTSPDYAGFSNYGYHLDAGAFSVFLREHCTQKLGVRLIADTMTDVIPAENGDIAAVNTQASGQVAGDLFVDCTGFRSLLLGGHYGVGLVSKSDVLFQDVALAVQVSYRDEDPVQSPTVSTAQPAGWIWDVSLSSRRGIGHVYSSKHMSEDQATSCIQAYLGMDESTFAGLSVRKLSIGSGYRETFWKQNCVAVGLSAGFLEPLEASALMLIENCANMIADALPEVAKGNKTAAESFNHRLLGLWDNIIHFLKLHYCLSEREEPFWKENRARESLPDDLWEGLQRWRKTGEMSHFAAEGMVFPQASYQYILYGMQCAGKGQLHQPVESEVERAVQRMKAVLEGNRSILGALNA